MYHDFRIDMYGRGVVKIVYLPTGDTYSCANLESCWCAMFDILKGNKAISWPIKFPPYAIDILKKNGYISNPEQETKLKNVIPGKGKA